MNAQLPVLIDQRTALVPLELNDLHDRPANLVRIGLIIAASFFVLFLGWAAFAPLDASAVGTGQVAVMGNRQTVQHRDGGVVAELRVREGQHVEAGQILIRLAGDEAEAQERSLAGSVIDLEAQRARLEAELSGLAIAWPVDFTSARPEDRPLVQRAMFLQERQFALRRSTLAAARSVSVQQQASISETSQGLSAEREATQRQIASMQDQLDRARAVAERGFISANYIRSLERAIAQLQGSQADYGSRASASREQVGATQSEYLQTQRHWIEDAGALMRDTQAQLNDQRPRWDAARDRVDHLLIRAPATGRVVGLQVFTVGGVINAGAPILDIVPDQAPLVVHAMFSPSDIDGVVPGVETEVKIGSLHERNIPILLGEVRTVSADSLTDQQNGQRYFTAEIFIPEGQLARLRQARGDDTGIRPGVPAQVFVRLRRRSALDYLIEPLTETFQHSGRER